jgi:ubiquinone/menaquinone biosynthesis C-methylase UbiE
MSSDNQTALTYHLHELQIATTIGDGRRSLPSVAANVQRMLDVGCGIGQSLIGLGLNPDVEAHGIDVDLTAIAFGKKKFPQLRLCVGIGEMLPYADRQFDLVVCRVALPYMHVPSALREFHRVLREGGTLWLVVHPLSMIVPDLRSAIRSRSLRGVVYRWYTLVNSLLLLLDRQFRFPFNRKRMESYQWAPAFRLSLRRAGFNSPTAIHRHRTLVVTVAK